MKKIILILLFGPVFLCAQSDLQFSEVVECEGTKEQLYSSALDWVATAYNNSNYVLRIKDKENGKIILKASFPYKQKKIMWGGSELSRGSIEYILTIQFKEGRYKYIFSDFYHDSSSSLGTLTTAKETTVKPKLTAKKWRSNVWNDLKEQATIKTAEIVTLLKEDIKKPAPGADW